MEKEKEYLKINVDILLKRIFLIVVVVALGILAVNQWVGFHYKSEVITKPCGVCKELNEDNYYGLCYTQCDKMASLYYRQVFLNANNIDPADYYRIKNQS